ncbi:sensor domain-containing diguanylate cyclase/phosphohydrolase [Clostridium septicum]|nr:HD domain-containing phosphohydrolase [Clostridium septicum]UEC20279.1 diguanylate cyclase [Clostridium septicum]USS01668.1 diguanylate cyclase [Clostridium septicum]
MNIYEMFIENVPWPIWIEDLESRSIFLNNEYKKRFIKKSNKTDENILNEQLLNKYKEEAKKKVLLGEVVSKECFVDDKFMKYYVIPLEGENKIVKAIAGVIIDITNSEEEALKLNNKKGILSTIIDSLPESIFYKNNKLQFIGFNKSFEDFFIKRGIKEIKGKNDFELGFNDDIASEFVRQDKEVMKEKKMKYFEVSINDSENKRIEEILKVPVINDNGNVLGIVGLSRDVTEKKLLEEKLRYLSYTDALTGLYNRSSFEEKIKELDYSEYLPLGIIMGDVNGLKLVNDTIGHLEGDKLLISISEVLKQVCKDIGYIFRWGGDEFIILLPNHNEKQCEGIIKEIIIQCKNHKYDFIQLSMALGNVIRESLKEDIYHCIRLVEERVYSKKLLESKSIKSSILNSFKKSLEFKSIETEAHTKRVIKYSTEIGKRLNFTLSQLEELTLVAQFHEIGKIGIKKEILLKQGALTKDEIEIMKTHVEKGYRIINAANELSHIANSVLTHHERWDGMGYPLGLKEKEIPLMARIVAIADSYDVMVMGRTYKKAIKKEEAVKKLKAEAGVKFDPEVVSVFLEYIKSN